jgi:hypothetical protein
MNGPCRPYHPVAAPGFEREAVVVAQIENQPTAAEPSVAWKLLTSFAESLEPAVLPALLPRPTVAHDGHQADQPKVEAAPWQLTSDETAPESYARRPAKPVWSEEQADAASRWLAESLAAQRIELTAAMQAVADEALAERDSLELKSELVERLVAQRVEALRKAAAESGVTVGLASVHLHPAPVQPLSADQLALRDKIHRALALYRHDRLLNTANQSPWEIMHRIVAYGIPTEIRRDGPTGDKVNAIGWMLWGGRCAGMPLVVLNGERPMVVVGAGLQGHNGQFVGMLAQSRVSANTPFKLNGKSFTLRDLIEEEKLGCESNSELTFKLIALSYYLKSDEEWTATDGQKWSISRLVQEEIRSPIRGAACGGSHRLFGLSSAVKMRVRDGLPVDGQFRRAQTFIHDYQRYTLGTLANPDGSFSTDWFTRAADSGDPARKLQTTGHILEWLVFSLDEDQLRDPRVVRSVDYLASMIASTPDREWSVGPLGHALHALAIYDDRFLSKGQPADDSRFASRPATPQPESPKADSMQALPPVLGATPSSNEEHGAASAWRRAFSTRGAATR